jgi:aspartate aminotransferase-like enzyme
MNRANFSTGPVALSEGVQRALSSAPISHRSDAFIDMLRETKHRLRSLVNANHVAIACGSGTLANEMIAQQLRSPQSRGLILINGEFGARLANIATRAGLVFDALEVAWGEAIALSAVARKLSADDYGWLWCVATETSTGSHFGIDALQTLAQQNSVRLCLDCMSAVGVAPLSLEKVFLASASSGKGLASVAGLAIVFAQSIPASRTQVPASLDLALHLHDGAVPFTLPSNLLDALHASLRELAPIQSTRYVEIAQDTARLRSALTRHQLAPLTGEAHAANGIVTIPLSSNIDSTDIGQRLRSAGIEIGFESDYLRRRNWIQIALMGHYPRAMVERLPELIRESVEQSMRSHTTPSDQSATTPIDHRADARFA